MKRARRWARVVHLDDDDDDDLAMVSGVWWESRLDINVLVSVIKRGEREKGT